MKKVFIFLLLLIGVIVFSQDYHFKYRKESITYRMQNGQTGSKQLSNESGDYLFRYENTYSNGKYEKIFTVFKNGQESFYCVETSNKGNVEVNGIIFQQSSFFHTGTSEVIQVFFSLDHNRIVILDLEGMAEYYN